MKVTTTSEPVFNTLHANNLDSEECARIPISFITSVQPHGSLLVIDRAEFLIRQISANFPATLGLQTEQVLGKPLGHFVMAQALEEIRRNSNKAQVGSNIPFTLWFSTPAKTVNYLALLHMQPEYILIELEEQHTRDAAPSFINVYQQVKQVFTLLSAAADTEEMLQVAAEEIMKISGFDRVMLYSFDRDWNGTVRGEARVPELAPYLDLRFPASDIPRQARELYLRTPYRVIPDSAYQPVPLVPELNPITAKPTNLSDCLLRGVPPVHLEYLQNMEVGASMSASIVKNGELWGLISCHHRTAKYLPYELRSAFELLANIISTELALRESRAILAHRNKLSGIYTKLLEHMAADNDFVNGLTRHSPNLLDYLDVSGGAILYEGKLTTVGQTPPDNQVLELINWLNLQQIDQLFTSDRLSFLFPEAEAYQKVASGLLALPLSSSGDAWLLGLRPEVVQLVKWGGNPNDHLRISHTDGKRVLHPRNSFAQWKETVRGTSVPWQDHEEEAALNLRNPLLEIILKVQTLKRLVAEEEAYKLSVVASKTDNAAIILSRDGKVEWLNHAFTNISHLNLAQAEGKNLSELAQKYPVLNQVAELLRKPENQQGSFSKEMNFEDQNGPHFLNFNFTPFQSPVNETESLVGIGLDITEMQLHAQKLETVNKELDRFTSIVAHDLKAPLSSIQALASAIEENTKSNKHPDTLELVGYMKRSLQQMNTLITDLLSYSRIGRVNLQSEQVNVRKLLEEVLEWLHPAAHITVNLPKLLPELRAVKVDLQQIFSNLLGNAIKYGCAASNCEINIHYSLTENGHLFGVQDSGPGIAQKNQVRIFEMFHSLPNENAREAGTGIGLATVKKLVEGNDGRIWVESEPGKGATFWFTLPDSPTEKL